MNVQSILLNRKIQYSNPLSKNPQANKDTRLDIKIRVPECIENKNHDFIMGRSLYPESNNVAVGGVFLDNGIVHITDSTAHNWGIGNGIGRKTYGMLFRKLFEQRQQGIKIDTITSSQDGRTHTSACHMWESLQRRGYPITNHKLNQEVPYKFALEMSQMEKSYEKMRQHNREKTQSQNNQKPERIYPLKQRLSYQKRKEVFTILQEKYGDENPQTRAKILGISL
jgi:hypothetical protein